VTASPRRSVSVVVPVYRNADTLVELHARITETLASRVASLEIVFVDDAGPDESGVVLDELAERDRRVTVLHLDENVGQHRAIVAGLSRAAGDVVVIIDADLQDPPEAIPGLLDALDDGCDVAFAGRHGSYHESLFRRLTSQLFKRLQRWLTGLPVDAGSYVAITRPVVERLLEMPSGPQTVVAMIGFAGRRVTSVPVTRAPRPSGRSAFTTSQRMSLGWKTLLWTVRMRLGDRPR